MQPQIGKMHVQGPSVEERTIPFISSINPLVLLDLIHIFRYEWKYLENELQG